MGCLLLRNGERRYRLADTAPGDILRVLGQLDKSRAPFVKQIISAGWKKEKVPKFCFVPFIQCFPERILVNLFKDSGF